MTIKIAHLSDLHLGVSKGKAIVSSDLEKLVLDQLHEEKPNAIIISGDITHLGLESDFGPSTLFLAKLKKDFPLLLIPGNTDCTTYRFETKKKTDDKPENQQKEPKKDEETPFKHVIPLPQPLILDGAHEPKCKQLSYVIKGDSDDGELYYGVVEDTSINGVYHAKDFKTYSKYFGEDIEPTLRVEGINFIGFDSCQDIRTKILATIFLKKSDSRFYVTEQMDGNLTAEHLERRLKKLPSGRNIAVMHHPPLFLQGSNPIHGRFNNGDETAKSLLEKGIQVALCGHKHMPAIEYRDIDGKNFYVIAAGTLFSNDIRKPSEDNSYNILHFDDDIVKVYVRDLHAQKPKRVQTFKLR